MTSISPLIEAFCIVFAIIAICAVIAGIVGSAYEAFERQDRLEDDAPNWNTVTALDLPITVTRVITADTTSFTYAPTRDEAFLFFSLDGEPLGTFEGPREAVRVSAPVSARQYREWPAAELKIVRQNGTEEIYLLPTRGGAVRWAFD